MPSPRDVRTAYEGGWIRVDVEDWGRLGSWEIVYKRDAVAVLPVTPDGDVLLVKQFRPALRETLTEIPAGLLDREGEDALACAARELFEETGYRHDRIEFLGGYYPSAGFTAEYVHLFAAWTAAGPEGSPEDGIEVARRPLEAMIEAAGAGRVRDSKTALALLLFAARTKPAR